MLVVLNLLEEVVKLLKKAAEEGSEKAAEYATKMTKNKALVKSLLNPFSEGAEEMGQRVSSTFSANYESEKLNNYYKRKIDPEAEEESVNWIKTLATSLNETVNDKSAWEEFLLGSLTGFMGVPSFQGVKNDKGDFQSPVKLNGGVFGGYKEYRDEMKKQQEIVDYLNERVQNPNFKNYYQSLIRHNSFQNQMDEAAERDDPFDYKNAEDAQFLNDIMMFDNAGAIDDLMTLINTSLDTSDENLESIINNTTSTIQKEDGETIHLGRFVEKSGVKHTDTPDLKQQMIEKLNSSKEEMIKNVNDYVRLKNEIDEQTNERFTNDQLQELTWLKYQVNRWDQRKEEIGLKSKPFFQKMLGELEQNLRIIDEVLQKEGESNKGITEKFNLFQKKKKDHETVRDIIKSIFDDGNNYSIATKLQNLNEEKFKNIAEELLKDNVINQQEYEETIKNLSDVQKMNEMQDRYNSRLQTYYKNPDILAEELSKQDEEVKNQHVQKILENFKNVNTVKDLRNNLKSIKPQLQSSVLDALGKSENTTNQKLVKDYKDLEEAKVVMDNLFNDYLDSSENSLKDVFDTLLNEVNSLEEFEQALKEDLKEIPEEFKESFKTIVEKYNDIKKSKKTTEKKKTTKKPQSKKKDGAKKKDGKRGFSLDNLSNDPNKPDKQQSEKDEEKGKKDKTSDNKKDQSPTEEAKHKSTPVSDSSDNISSEEPVDSSTPSSSKDEQKQSEDSVLRSWANNLTLYDFNLLKGDERKAVQRSNAAINALIKLGAYSFVDSGKLGKLVNKVESGFRKKEKIKIHYVVSKDPNLNGVVLLAIELTPDVLKTVKSGDNPITINGKQYQVVGTLGSNKAGKTNYEQIKRALFEESSKGFTGDYFISEKFSNEIKHIYSGRMVKSVEGEPVSKRPVNKSFLSKNGLNKLHLGFYYSDGDFRTPSIDTENELIEVPNYNNTNPRQGSVWLMVQEADGIWYPKYVEVKRFTKLDFNLEENLNTPILKNIIEQLKIITDINKNVQDRLKARTVLENILYFGKNIDGGIDHKIFFTEKLDKQGNIIDVIINVKDIGNNIGAGTDQLTKIQLILEALQDPSLNLRFQIKPAQFSSDNTINDILESGILVTDLYQPMNVNASFDLYPNDIETGGIIKKEEEGI